MTLASVVATLLAVSVVAGPGQAQQPTEEEMMAAWAEAMAVGPQHQKLAERVGSWAMTTTFWMDPAAPPQVEHGTAERVMTMDGRVLEERVSGQMMGAPYAGEGRMGFDNITGRYWSTWTDTMTTGLIVMHGDHDAAIDTYVFEGQTHDPLMGSMPMRIEAKIEDGREINLFFIQTPDGAMTQMMEIVYQRQ